MEYFKSGKAKDEYTDRIEAEVNSVRNGEKWRADYMTFEMRLQEEREDGRTEGKAEGRLFTICEFVKDGIIPLSEAARRLNMSEEEFEEQLKKA